MVKRALVIFRLCVILAAISSTASAKSLSLISDIELRTTHEPCMETGDPVAYSPDGRFFAVYSTRGSLTTNEVSDEIRIYRTADVDRDLSETVRGNAPSPYWVIEGRNREGPVIASCRWLANSQGIAFVERSHAGNRVLKLGEVAERRVKPLSPADDSVDEFDVADATHFVYRVKSLLDDKGTIGPSAVSVDVTGQSLASLLVPDSVASVRRNFVQTSATGHLWAAMGDKPVEVSHGDLPLVVSSNLAPLALSPSGDSVVTSVPVDSVPRDWEERYPPPVADASRRIRAGLQNPEDIFSARRYVRIDLRSGEEFPLAEGPTGNAAGWPARDAAGWSGDGRRLVLSSAYAGFKVNGRQRPCIAVADAALGLASCLLPLKGRTNQGFDDGEFFAPLSAQFEDGNPHVATVALGDASGTFKRSLEFREAHGGDWQMTVSKASELTVSRGLRIWIDEDLNRSPRLMAARGRKSVLLWDLNPELVGVDLANVSVYRWHDPLGKQWTGGLFSPPDFHKGGRYPLIIQTHGFVESQFNPDGMYTTGSAAQVLAAAGFVVLQVRDGPICGLLNAEEGKCAAAGYDAAVRQLAADGYVDSAQVGLEGFSRTCIYVTHALAFGDTKYRAATLTDGVTESYMLYFTVLDASPWFQQETDVALGAPVGTGLLRWIQESPIFHLERNQAAVQINALGKESLLTMWEPYARLRYSNKPVDLTLFNTSEHTVTNPMVRLASQGGAVDWFRFWLQGYERKEPVVLAGETRESLEGQYSRWRGLKALQSGS